MPASCRNPRRIRWRPSASRSAGSRALADAALLLLLAALAGTDLRARRLPLPLLRTLITLGLLRHAPYALPDAIASAAIAAAPLWLLRRLAPQDDPRWRLGGGDLRLAFGLGAWLGAPLALATLGAGFALAAAAAIATRTHTQPYGTWCALAVLLIWFAA